MTVAMAMAMAVVVGLAAVLGSAAGTALGVVVQQYCDRPVARRQLQFLASAGCGVAALCGSGPMLVVTSALVLWCACLSVIDLHTMRLPNPLTGIGAAGVALFAAATGRWPAAALGAVLLAGAYLLADVLASARGSRGFGGGDVKLAVGLGGATAMAGGQVWLIAAVGALVLTATAGLCLRSRWDSRVPHGPSMCLASLITLAALG